MDINTLLYKINNLHNLEYIKLNDLEIEKPYSATDFRFVNGRYGKQIDVVLDDRHKLTLPKKYSEIFTDEIMKQMNQSLIKIIYKGGRDIYFTNDE